MAMAFMGDAGAAGLLAVTLADFDAPRPKTLYLLQRTSSVLKLLQENLALTWPEI